MILGIKEVTFLQAKKYPACVAGQGVAHLCAGGGIITAKSQFNETTYLTIFFVGTTYRIFRKKWLKR